MGEVIIAIRSSEEIRTELKKVAADFGSYDNAIRAFLKAYKEHPEMFKEKEVYLVKGEVRGLNK